MLGSLRCFFLLLFSISVIYAEKFMATMPGARPQRADDYICTRIPLPEFEYAPGYITAFKPIVNASVHHIILSACNEWLDGTEAEHPGPCVDQCRTHILYAWAHNGAPLALPEDTAFEIGRGASIKSLSLEVHYSRPEENPDYASIELTYTRQPQRNRAGVILLYNAEATIPPHVQHFPTNISCRLHTEVPIQIIGVRTHAHDLNRGVYGYYFSPLDKHYHLIAKGNAQWPQTFYKPSQLSSDSDFIRLQNGDILMGRCIYDSTDRDTQTSMGSTHADEMCNLYLMYSVDSRFNSPVEPELCQDEMVPGIWDEAPHESLEYVTSTPPPKAPTAEVPHSIEFLPDPEWFIRDIRLGIVSGIALADVEGQTRLFVLRRGENPWSIDSFDANFVYDYSDATYVPSPILYVDALSGRVLQTFGDNLFLLPHGLSIAKDTTGKPTALWATDVALHQVMKFNWNEWSKPALVLGSRGQPGNDEESFCLPTDVAVASTGEIFVADGYCNQRVVKFDPNGKYLTEWGAGGVNGKEDSKGGFLVVHSITIVPASTESTNGVEQVCVADRDNAQIDCYDLSGKLLARYGGSILLPSVYAVTFSPEYKLMFGVTGSLNGTPSRTPHLLSFLGVEEVEEDSVKIGNSAFAFRPLLVSNATKSNHSTFVEIHGSDHLLDLDLRSPHDLEVSQDGSMLFVAQLKAPYLSKIDIINSVLTAEVRINSRYFVHQPAGTSGIVEKTLKNETRSGEGELRFPSQASMPRTLFQKIFIFTILITLCAVVVIMALILFRSRKSHLWTWNKPVHFQRRSGNRWEKLRRYDGFQPLPQDEIQGLTSSALDSEDEATTGDSNTIIDIRKLGISTPRKRLSSPQSTKNTTLTSSHLNHHIDT